MKCIISCALRYLCGTKFVSYRVSLNDRVIKVGQQRMLRIITIKANFLREKLLLIDDHTIYIYITKRWTFVLLLLLPLHICIIKCINVLK